MADGITDPVQFDAAEPRKPWQMSVDEAREHAKARFRERLVNGEQVGGCSCSSDEEATPDDGAGRRVLGVRFRDSGRVYFFKSGDAGIDVGTWVACTTSRGQEAGRVVIAPKQVLASRLDGELKPIDRVLRADDVERIDQQRRDAARAVRRAGEISRYYDFGIKVVSAEYSLDAAHVRIAFSASDHSFVEDLRDMVAEELGVEVHMHHVGPRDEARLIGGLGKCGRTLCCSSWLPMYPEVTMGMARNQDLSLNPSKVSGLCGRLLCCLSYENEQYRKARQILPRLGQTISTPDGDAVVVSLQVLKELVTVRLTDPYRDQTYPAAELLGNRRRRDEPVAVDETTRKNAAPDDDHQDVQEKSSSERKPRRRRRRRRAGGERNASTEQN